MFEELQARFRDRIVPLLGDLGEDAQQLFRAELALAKAELRQNASEFQQGFATLALGLALLLVAYIGFLIGLGAAATDLLPQFPLWGYWLIVTLIHLSFGLHRVMKGRAKLKSARVIPVATIDSLQDCLRLIANRYH